MAIDHPALERLRQLTGNGASSFRDGQLEAITALVEQRAKVLVVQRTGWGKSAVYFIATQLLRAGGAGPTMLISPLLALMRNQILMAKRGGVRAEAINSDNEADWDRIEAEIASNEIDLLLISPERLDNKRFAADVLPQLVKTVGMVVIDEAHCISDWGHDFRPDYRRLSRVIEMLPDGVPVLCTTATANDRVVTDIAEQLRDLDVIRGPLERESLRLAVLDLPQPAERLAWLARELPTMEGSGIVYCLTIGDTERVASWLTKQGIDAIAYSGDSEAADRPNIENALLANEVKVVVATSALGMGFDKPDLSFVIHYQSPGSPIAYYQQVGRAGRALDAASGVLLRGNEDADIQDYFIRTAFPSRAHAEAVIDLLVEADAPVSVWDIQAAVNVRYSRLLGMLKILEVEGAIEKEGRGWRRTPKPWTYPADRVEQVTALRRAEQEAMNDYARTHGCRMRFLRALLDDDAPEACGRCDNCTGVGLVRDLDPAVVAEAVQHLRAQSLTVEPRKQWPYGMSEVRGKIPEALRAQAGRALSVYGDGGWGSVVRSRRRGLDGVVAPDELIDAAVRLIASWSPAPAPEWVSVVPSARCSEFVADAARRIAGGLGLPFVEAVRRARQAPPQGDMQNSAQQVRNVLGAFASDGAIPASPALLIDDIVGSGWTLTVAAQVLLEAGSGPVFPFLLARGVGD